MALEVKTLKDQEEQMSKGWIANRDLFLDKDGNVVEAGDPKSAFLLARKGRLIPEASMKAHKVKKTRPKAEADADADAGESSPESEAEPKPKRKTKTKGK